MQILLLDHEEWLHTTLEFKLQKSGMKPIFLPTIEAIMKELDNEGPTVVMVDLDQDSNVAQDLVEACHAHNGQIPIIGVTALEDESIAMQWLEHGVLDFVAKPYKTSEIIVRIQKALFTKKLLNKA